MDTHEAINKSCYINDASTIATHVKWTLITWALGELMRNVYDSNMFWRLERRSGFGKAWWILAFAFAISAGIHEAWKLTEYHRIQKSYVQYDSVQSMGLWFGNERVFHCFQNKSKRDNTINDVISIKHEI